MICFLEFNIMCILHVIFFSIHVYLEYFSFSIIIILCLLYIIIFHYELCTFYFNSFDITMYNFKILSLRLFKIIFQFKVFINFSILKCYFHGNNNRIIILQFRYIDNLVNTCLSFQY